MPNFMKICPVEVKLFHVDGQTDMPKIKSHFSQICERA